MAKKRSARKNLNFRIIFFLFFFFLSFFFFSNKSEAMYACMHACMTPTVRSESIFLSSARKGNKNDNSFELTRNYFPLWANKSIGTYVGSSISLAVISEEKVKSKFALLIQIWNLSSVNTQIKQGQNLPLRTSVGLLSIITLQNG